MDKVVATLTIPDGAELTSQDVQRITAWLREEAKFIRKNGHNLAMRYRARLMQVPVKPRKSLSATRRRSS